MIPINGDNGIGDRSPLIITPFKEHNQGRLLDL